MKDSPTLGIRSNPIDHFSRSHKLSIGRLVFIVIVFIVLLSGCTLRKTRIYQVGILSGMNAFLSISEGYKNKMAELGYIEGKNIEYNYMKLNDDLIEENTVLKNFINEKVDLILVFPSRPAMTAKVLTQGTGIPVVFAGASIEGTNLVESQRQPGGNITGVRFPTPELNAKRLELLLVMAPKVKRILIFYDINYPSYPSARKAINDAADNNHVTLIENQVTSLEEMKSSLEAREKLSDIGVDAIFLMPDLLTSSMAAWEIIKPFAIKYRLPVASDMDYNLKDAGLFMLDSSHIEIGGLAAVISDKILRGTPAGAIPVASPNMNLHINYRRAQELGLTIPGGLLKLANEVIY